MPYTNKLARHGALASNYYAVAHPSLTNYLEIIGGSNFGVINDHSPAWHDLSCQPNLITGLPALDESSYPNVCPIHGTGTDAATPAIDLSNLEGNQPGPVINIDGTTSIPAEQTAAKTIAHQIVANGGSWKAYEEDLPPAGADSVNSADGIYSNLYSPPQFGITDAVLGLYAVKHNPLAYFQDIQQGYDPQLSLANMVGFTGPTGLFADLIHDRVPTFSYIVPNQCNDQHGRTGAGPKCDYDPKDVGTLVGLNPALMYQGDVTFEHVVGAIKTSSTWKNSRSAIVIVWDESDYSVSPITNQVTLIVDTSDGNSSGVVSKNFYTHFSLLKTMESALGLPCLNNACSAPLMKDIFDGPSK